MAEVEVREAGGNLPRANRRGTWQSAAPAIRSLVGRVPWAATAVGVGLFLLLAAFVSADPAPHATFSSSPFSDEGFNVVNARNFVQLGRWQTDEWNLHLVNLPFSLLTAASMWLLGVGIVAARLVSIACVAATAFAMAFGLRRTLGTTWASVAGLAFAGSGLVLYYGRLAYDEDLVVLALTLGALVVTRADRMRFRWGLVSGAWFAVAIGTKPSAMFAVAGLLAALAFAWGWRSPAMRRWLAGAVIAIGTFGVGWLLLIWLPNRDAVAMDMRIWAPIHLALSPLDQARALSSYVRGGSDGIVGWMLGPLLALAAVGSLSIALWRRRLDEDQRRLAVAALGWVLAGFWIVIVASYRPNRYLLPMAPGLAILAAIGLKLLSEWLARRMSPVGSSDGASAQGTQETPLPGVHREIRTARVALAVAVAAGVIAIAPGLALFANWQRQATYELPRIETQMANLVPAGERVAGRESALFLMRSEAITVEVQLTQTGTEANRGDLYATGVRWYLQPDDAPSPPGVSAATWAMREKLACGRWAGMVECLYRVP